MSWTDPVSEVARDLLAPRARRSDRRVPVVLQMTAVECGAACLAMMLCYYGRRTTIAECRATLGPGRDGLTARAIARAAQVFGLRVRALSLEPEKLDVVPLPFVAHWRFEHFVIVEAITRGGYHLVDPECGRRRVSREEFERSFTGVLLAMEPGDDFHPGRGAETSGALRQRLWTAARLPGVRAAAAQLVFASLLLQVFGLALPLFTKVMVDRVLVMRLDSALPILGLVMALWVVALVLVGYLRVALLIYLRGHIDARLMLGFFEHLLHLPLAFFQRRSSGDLLMRLSSNMVVRDLLTEHSLSVLLDGGLVVTYLVILFAVDWRFGLATAAIGVSQIVVLLVSAGPVHRVLQNQLLAQAQAQSYSVETLKGIETIKGGGSEIHVFNRWSSLFYNQLNVTLKRSHLNATVQVVLQSLQSLAPLLLLWLGTWQVLAGGMTLGTMLALTALAGSLLGPLTALAASGQKIQLVRAHLERLTDVLEADPEKSEQGSQVAPVLTGSVSVEGLSFRYDEQSPWVLQNVTFSVEPGQKVAITGPTGSGKSTLMALLLGLYEPNGGTIRYDHQPLGDFDLSSLRQQFGVIPQTPFLFSGSIRENLALLRPEASYERILAAARLVSLHDEISRMPMGYETRVSEGGAALSGGQRQRICIARALLNEPRVLLLDEATSSLDTETERTVQQALDELGVTQIVIAHRLTTIANADRVLVFDRGRVVEQGSPKSLLAEKGKYAELFQASGPGDEHRELSSVRMNAPRT